MLHGIDILCNNLKIVVKNRPVYSSPHCYFQGVILTPKLELKKKKGSKNNPFFGVQYYFLGVKSLELN